MSQRTRWGRSAAALALGMATLAIAGGSPADQQRERFTVTGGEVVIYDLAGEVRVEQGTGSAVVVEVSRGGRDAADLKIETGAKGAAQTLRVIYPGDRIVYRGEGHTSSSLQVDSDGTFGDDHHMQWLTGRRVTVATFGSGREAWADLRILVPRGQRIRVHHVLGRTHVTGVDGDLTLDESASHVEVRDTKGRLAVDVGSGSVSVTGAQGDVSVDTGSGSVEVSTVHGGKLLLDTGSGSIHVQDVAVDRLSADTGSGTVDLDQVSAAEVMIDTGSGGVMVDLSSDIEHLEADTGSGSVTIAVPAKLGADFDIETGSGGIDVDIPHEAFTIEHDHLTGRIGDGRGRIHVDTGSGGVRLVRRSATSQRTGMVLGSRLLPEIG